MLVMGGTWNADTKYLADLTVTKRVKQLRLVTMIYDVIPVRFPHFTTKNYGDAFAVNLKRMICEADRLLSISECTSKEVLAYCADASLIPPDIDVVRLGDEIEADETVDLDVLREVDELLRDRPFILTVSTITPRKNHEMLYHLWMRLLNDYGAAAPVLVIVGKPGYNSESFIRTLQQDIRVQDYIVVLHDVADSLLHWLYEKCLFTLYPTLFEGWGLPVAESLAYGKVCLASNISSVPEIAPDFTELIDPNDFMEWYSQVVRFAFNEAARNAREAEIRSGYRSTTWAEGAARISEILDRPTVSRGYRSPLCARGADLFCTGFACQRHPSGN